jgi:hypothetical protein
MQSAECRVQSTEYQVPSTEFLVPGSWFRLLRIMFPVSRFAIRNPGALWATAIRNPQSAIKVVLC